MSCSSVLESYEAWLITLMTLRVWTQPASPVSLVLCLCTPTWIWPTIFCVQCAAVMTQLGAIRVPPQKCEPLARWSETSHWYCRGYSTSVPPMMRLTAFGWVWVRDGGRAHCDMSGVGG